VFDCLQENVTFLLFFPRIFYKSFDFLDVLISCICKNKGGIVNRTIQVMLGGLEA